MNDNTVKIGLIGFGTVGSGVAKILLEDKEIVKSRMGVDLELKRIVDLDTVSQRPVKIPSGMLTDNLDDILKDNDIDVVIELIGGTGIAKEVVAKSLDSGKHVVTANKALLAKHGIELYEKAKNNGKCIAFEASCGGGIPIVSALRSGLTANNINNIYGILNGTCNYILTSMAGKNEDFPVALKKAQELGYAEADPTLDINGGDTGHKLAILASIAFGYEIEFDDVYVEGIEKISIDDIHCGEEMGYVLKLLGIAEKNQQGQISLRVVPAFISKDDLISKVDGPFNAVSVFGSSVGKTMYYGRGAGMLPTASAIVADIIEIALGNSQRLFESVQLRPKAEAQKVLVSAEEHNSRFYVRLMAKDEPGVLATIADLLGKNSISISGALQHEGKGPENTVPVIITTHMTAQKNITCALKQLSSLEVIGKNPVCIEIVDIPEDED